MYRAKLVALASVGLFAHAALTVTTAFAATEGWMVNKSLLSGSAPLTVAKATENAKISAAGVAIGCNSSEVEGFAGEITAPNQGSAASVVFSGCSITEGAGCSLAASTISTVPIATTEITLDGALAVKGAFKPQTKTTFATIKYNGETCALLGVQPITGKARFLAGLGQDEMTWQPVLVFNEGTELKEGSSTAAFMDTVELATESLEPWSFL